MVCGEGFILCTEGYGVKCQKRESERGLCPVRVIFQKEFTLAWWVGMGLREFDPALATVPGGILHIVRHSF